MASSFSLVTRTTAPIEDLFDISLNIDQHVASMDQSRESAIGGITDGSITLGESVTWRARHFGVWFTMTSQITSLERPVRFVDEQVRGPFRSFHHEHSFTREGKTSVMVDSLTIGSPVFGKLAERVVLVPYLRRLIRQRNHRLLTALNAAPGTEPQSSIWPVDEASALHRSETTALIGRGGETWERASRDVLRWKVKTRSGFTVDVPQRVSPDTRLMITARVFGIMIREPVQVATVIETASRVGFSYRTLPGHPVSGEEAFIVHRDGDDVFLTIRSLTAPASKQPWRALYPFLRIVQIVARRRYLRSLH
ncbi:DUF1990 family protein [Cryobacterium sp. PH31-AA6]|uniref:DUF1990 family protein n=1 Tax=Cryobacterium sp. PH31-AA6 TaxID=3046205 RepID=UPI0024BB0AD0|nr:DUF1990 family protein [Cryobacterium sp. PH31-AA6]MDJ0325333.1 DUF1990 family protein [Cryobacterium sp. PH31-AA6]